MIRLKLKGRTYLENRFKMRPLGVVSKKLIGLRKMAYAILSCSFREAYDHESVPDSPSILRPWSMRVDAGSSSCT